MLMKNESFGELLWKLPFRVFLDAVAAWRGLLSGDGGYFVAILKAHLQCMGWLLGRRSQSVFPVQKGGKPGGWFTGSVVWAHFVQKKKTFSEIVGGK